MKELFEEPKFDVIFVDDVDIITSSGEVKPCCDLEEARVGTQSLDLDQYLNN